MKQDSVFDPEKIDIFIDGKRVEYTRFLDDPVLSKCGTVMGCDGRVKDDLWIFTPNKTIGGLAIANDNEGWSINAVYGNCWWKSGRGEKVEFHVENRIT